MTGHTVEKAIDSLKEGNFVLVYDADGREEETDFFISAEMTTPEAVRRMRKDGGGLIFLMVSEHIANKLGLPFLADLFSENAERYPIFNALIPDDIPYDVKSSFSLSINHRKTFTGITDVDRALTARRFGELADAILESDIQAAREMFGREFRSPGHVPICAASKHPLKERFGHTELSVALMTLAGLNPISLGCEMMGDDGRSLKKEDARRYAEEHGFVFLEGRQIIEEWNKWKE